MSKIKLICLDCHAETKKEEYEPYTGMRHGRGWVYVCEKCHGTMAIKGEEYALRKTRTTT